MAGLARRFMLTGATPTGDNVESEAFPIRMAASIAPQHVCDLSHRIHRARVSGLAALIRSGAASYAKSRHSGKETLTYPRVAGFDTHDVARLGEVVS